MRRLAPSPLTAYVRVRNLEPSTIAIVRRRRDRRDVTTEFVDQAAETAERHIDLLKGAEVVR